MAGAPPRSPRFGSAWRAARLRPSPCTPAACVRGPARLGQAGRRRRAVRLPTGVRVAARRQRRGRDAVVRRLELADAGSEGSGRDSSPGGAGPGSGAGAATASLSSARTGATGALLWGAAPDRLPPASQVTSVRCAPARQAPRPPPLPPRGSRPA